MYKYIIFIYSCFKTLYLYRFTYVYIYIYIQLQLSLDIIIIYTVIYHLYILHIILTYIHIYLHLHLLYMLYIYIYIYIIHIYIYTIFYRYYKQHNLFYLTFKVFLSKQCNQYMQQDLCQMAIVPSKCFYSCSFSKDFQQV